jgi:cytochrome c
MVYLGSDRAAIRRSMEALMLLPTVAWEHGAGLLGIGSVMQKSCGAARTMTGRTVRIFLLGILAAALAVLGAPGPVTAQEGKAEDGAEVFKKCRACHDVGPDAKNKVGPLLNNIVGRKAGTIEGFAYSEANKNAGGKGLTWTEGVLLKYLENPLVFMPGTKMAFAGLKDERDRRDLIAFLKTHTK